MTRISQLQEILPGMKSQHMRTSDLLAVSMTSLTQTQRTCRFTLYKYISMQNQKVVENSFFFSFFQVIFASENDLIKSKNNGYTTKKAKQTKEKEKREMDCGS